jgi:hypothetical protein
VTRRSASKLFNTEGGQIKAENLFFLAALVAILLANRDYFADDFYVEPRSFGFAVNLFNIIGERFLFFFELFNSLDEGAQMPRVDVLRAGVIRAAHAVIHKSVG